MKKTYQSPSLTIVELTGAQPLLSSPGQPPTIGNSYDEEGSKGQFSNDKNWETSWTEE